MRILTRLALVCGALTCSVVARGGELPPAALHVGGPCPQSSSVSPEQFDHSEFDLLLRTYGDSRGQVCYGGWARNCCDLQRLRQYLHTIGHANLSTPASREARLALGINAYNALAILGILQEYPVPSIQLLNRQEGAYRIFDDLKVWLGGQYVSLNQIENDFLRPQGDHRIHFALVCAARGCPKLQAAAYFPATINQQLATNAVDFFADPAHFRIAGLKRKVLISPILKWY